MDDQEELAPIGFEMQNRDAPGAQGMNGEFALDVGV